MADSNESGNTPAVENPVTPTGDGQTPSQPQGNPDNVSLTKEQYDALQRQAAQASEAQSRADRATRLLAQNGKRKVAETENFENVELVEVRGRLTSQILTNPKYRDLVSGDPVLAQVLSKNPLDLLNVNEFIDVEDAVSQVIDYLDERISSKPASSPAQPNISTPEAVVAPSAVPLNPNPTNVQPVKTPAEKDAESQSKLRPMQRIEQKIAGRINVN